MAGYSIPVPSSVRHGAFLSHSTILSRPPAACPPPVHFLDPHIPRPPAAFPRPFNCPLPLPFPLDRPHRPFLPCQEVDETVLVSAFKKLLAAKMMAHDPNAFPDGARRFRLRAFPERFWMFLSRVSKCFCNSSVSERFCRAAVDPTHLRVREFASNDPKWVGAIFMDSQVRPSRHPMTKPYAPTLPATLWPNPMRRPSRHSMAKPCAPTLPDTLWPNLMRRPSRHPMAKPYAP